jgi:hypothetical protein
MDKARGVWRRKLLQEGNLHMPLKTGQAMAKALLTDVQLWVPALVLLLGIVLLVVLH